MDSLVRPQIKLFEEKMMVRNKNVEGQYTHTYVVCVLSVGFLVYFLTFVCSFISSRRLMMMF